MTAISRTEEFYKGKGLIQQIGKKLSSTVFIVQKTIMDMLSNEKVDFSMTEIVS